MTLQMLLKAGDVSKELDGINKNSLMASLDPICDTMGSLGCGSFGCNSQGGCC